jgi:protein-glutamine gamma-glutamyltransferase
MSASRTRRDTSIPRQPLLWLATALLFTLPPMFGSLATWVPTFFLLTLTLKFWMEPKGYRLRSPTWKLVLAAVTLAAIFFSYGSLKGIAPGVSVLVVLMSLKVLEAHTAREFQVMTLIAWVLCLCGFFLSQDLAVALCLLVAFALLLVALIQFHGGSSAGNIWPPLGATCKLLVGAAPLTVLMFVMVPRINTGFPFEIRDAHSAASGFSDQLSPGSITSLANSSEVAFRAEFPDRKTRPPGPMYWRGVVMWHCEGMEWRAPYGAASISSPEKPGAPSGRALSAKAIRQRITIEPHGAHWMFGLDRPFAAPPGATLAGGNYLWSIRPIRKARRYEVASSPEITGKELQPRERNMALEVSASITPAVRELAQSWAAQNSNPRSIVNSALQFFRTERFRYSLSPGQYNKNDLEEFLFHRRVGFCEHYAASFAILMRLAGIPARVVVGYLGGEYNDLGRFVLVRQSDTHAWCEVWLPDSGWTRVDPTSAVVPGRANLGLNSFLERRAASGEIETGQSRFVARLTQLAIFTNIRLAWEALKYEWDTRVLGFDADVQDSFLNSIGVTNDEPFLLITETLVLAAVLLAIYAGWMHVRTRPQVDRVQRLYERFCRRAARLGARRSPWEGPSDFSSRAARLLPDQSEHIRQISNAYIALRYSPQSGEIMLDRFAKEVGQFPAHRQIL